MCITDLLKYRKDVFKTITDLKTLVKLMPLFGNAVQNAIGVEVHENRYFADTDTVQFHELIGGYVDGATFVPVRFGVKESKNGSCKLHVVVCQNPISLQKITTEVMKPVSTDNAAAADSRSVTISIARFAQNVNTQDADILRYLPDNFLNEEQKAVKYAKRSWQRNL